MSELSSFHQFLTQKIDQFGDATSPEEALDMWRANHPAPKDFDEDVEAIREAIQDMNEGDRGLDLKEFEIAFRARHQIV